MATLRDIRRRIQGVKSTQKITKAMKMVAAAKLRRAQENIVSARPYARKMSELMRHLVRRIDVNISPLLMPREVKKVALMIVTADRGMCGAFNSNIVKTANNYIQTDLKAFTEHAGDLKLMLVGKKGSDIFSKSRHAIYGKHIGIFSHLDYGTVYAIVDELLAGYLKGEFDRIDVIYNEFKSVIQQRVIVEQFLPIPPEELKEVPHLKALAQVEYIYEPSEAELINQLIPRHLNFQMWRIMLESNAAEQGARMAAMDNATTNANELISSLTLSYNKARQSTITKELLEIVSGAEALTKGG
jgi:F-type H+-transporting ATPase subunit gamma